MAIFGAAVITLVYVGWLKLDNIMSWVSLGLSTLVVGGFVFLFVSYVYFSLRDRMSEEKA